MAANEVHRRDSERLTRMQGVSPPRRVLAVALAALVFAVAGASACFATDGCADGGSPLPLEQYRGPGDEGGVGGTGVDREGGIGGTGISRGPGDEGGIGGTGVDPEDATAVVGTVTGFASICVGGTEIHYTAETSLRIDGADASARALAVGQIVEVIAVGGAGGLEAKSIAINHTLSGPVTAVDPGHEWIAVMGQRVMLSEASFVETEAVTAGAWVDVSGLWRGDGAVVASRVDRARLGNRARVMGRLGPGDEGYEVVGDVRLRPASVGDVDAAAEIVAVGRWVDGVLVADSIEASPRATLPTQVRRAQIEGYVEATDKPSQVQVGGWTVDVREAERGEWAKMPVDRRVQLNGVVDRHGRLVPERVQFPEPRRYGSEPHAMKPPPRGVDGTGSPPKAPDGLGRGRGVEGKPAPPGPPKGARPPDAQRAAPPPRPRAQRPPVPERPQRPDIPRAQRRPPGPPPGGRPPKPPRPPR